MFILPVIDQDDINAAQLGDAWHEINELIELQLAPLFDQLIEEKNTGTIPKGYIADIILPYAIAGKILNQDKKAILCELLSKKGWQRVWLERDKKFITKFHLKLQA